MILFYGGRPRPKHDAAPLTLKSIVDVSMVLLLFTNRFFKICHVLSMVLLLRLVFTNRFYLICHVLSAAIVYTLSYILIPIYRLDYSIGSYVGIND